ncbi:GNAT family N-acetyltransferase [Kushneria phosphatilytica]|uniref:GNAT family N-acetyltransferase n=1 Tax=Kushneria phosphatilytica TaxID=657387 RepID=A0A1S1NNN6_9GAMM|nr:GNAT family N-acetyltransferase [Kushneria phosphatilytica]OHV08937.1 GNAT family N-acetyltransferase [Kushneria phosphatilytica]QEL09687.1 GNAT family N-acetyltransferase [Kushneria phosphatilytica]
MSRVPLLQFRTATSEDIPALVELVTTAYRGEASRAGWTTEADLLDGTRIVPEVLADDLARPDSRVLIGEDRSSGELVACAHLEAVEKAAYFGMFAVLPDCQGAGAGRALLAEAERVSRDELKRHRIRMTVIDVRHELIAWYERRGYRKTGESHPFPYGDTRFGTPKRDDLQFTVLEKTLSGD